MSEVTPGVPRDDLAVVEFDGDLVVYDAVAGSTHVLTGGAAVVWAELELGGPSGVAARVAERVGRPTDEVAPHVIEALGRFDALGLLHGPAERP